MAKPGKGSVEAALDVLYLHAHLPELGEFHLEVAGVRAFNQHVAARGGGRHYKGAGLHAIAYHRVLDGA